MPLQLLDAEDADMPRTFELFAETLSYIPFFRYAFPDCNTAEGRQAGGERMLLWKTHDPNAKFLKVVDTETGEIIGAGKWEILQNYVPPEEKLDGDFWKNPEDKKIAQHIGWEGFAPRRQAIRETNGNILALDFISVDPKHRRRGAGRLIVEHGTQLADRLGSLAVIEATDNGKWLYEAVGFYTEKYVKVPYPDDWTNVEKQEYYWMLRKPQSKS